MDGKIVLFSLAGRAEYRARLAQCRLSYMAGLARTCKSREELSSGALAGRSVVSERNPLSWIYEEGNATRVLLVLVRQGH